VCESAERPWRQQCRSFRSAASQRSQAAQPNCQQYLEVIRFEQATRGCRDTIAYTAPGSRVVFLCAPAIERAWRENPDHLVASLIHEMLHTLGLGENPPSSAEITARVLSGCGRLQARPKARTRTRTEAGCPHDPVVLIRGDRIFHELALLAPLYTAYALLDASERPQVAIRLFGDPSEMYRKYGQVPPRYRTVGAFVSPDKSAIYVSCDRSGPYGQPNRLAATLAHEAEHVAGGDEYRARSRELGVLRRLATQTRHRDDDYIRRIAADTQALKPPRESR
jgi:hypothetical protein